MNKVNFIIGEDKKVRIQIHATDDTHFSIQSSSYELTSRDEVVDSGICDIDDHMLICQISPPSIGHFYLKITYEIANEIFKERIEVNVN